MSAGLMTLAYIAEMAIVFNLAYRELNKNRYIEDPKRDIELLRVTIKSEDSGSDRDA